MKKMYKQPEMEIFQVEPMTIMNVSIGEGTGGTEELGGGGGGPQVGDAPKRRVF